MVEYVPTRADDVKQSLELVDLLGGRTAMRNLASGHPLRLGFTALEKYLAGQKLSDLEKEDKAVLGMRATTLLRHREEWRQHEAELVSKLRSSKDAPSLLFELDVATFVLQKHCGSCTWQTFDEGAPDWRATSPDVEVECKLARSTDKANDYRSYLGDAARQHPDPTGPLVVAVGFNGVLSAKALSDMVDVAERYIDWLPDHPNIAGVLVLGRTGVLSHQPGPLGLDGLAFAQHQVIESRNHGGKFPLPQNFRFGDGPEVLRKVVSRRR